ncbi:MAG: potassium channel family protein, partial [Polyangiales bacterium]
GITRALGVVAALHDDKDNIFATITARALNPGARIVAKAVEHSAEDKLRRAGADAVVSPNYIGGIRLAGEMVRPSVVQFLDRMIRDQEMTLRIEEITISEGSDMVGCTLANSQIRDKTNALVLAVRQSNGTYHYNPSGDFVIAAGTTLIVIAQTRDLAHLRTTLC